LASFDNSSYVQLATAVHLFGSFAKLAPSTIVVVIKLPTLPLAFPVNEQYN
jgi:hypothetical protein